MISAQPNCAHCGVEIVDPTTRIVHANQTFCCPNCSAAMDATGSGSDKRALQHDESLRCEHCGVPIVHEDTMETRDNEAYCCANCARAGSRGLGTPGLADTTTT
jgi:DNA-directed RNA polymerase subunit RPC12/RpoP